jgi:hypothetical protein
VRAERRGEPMEELAVGSWELAVLAWLPAASAPAGNSFGVAGGASGEKVATANCQLLTPDSPNLLTFL